MGQSPTPEIGGIFKIRFLSQVNNALWLKNRKPKKQDGIEWTGDGYKMVDNNNGRIKQIEMKWNEWNEME